MKKKPTRRELLMVVGHLQELIGRGRGTAMNDRNQNRAAQVDEILRTGFELCVEVRSFDPIIEDKGCWGECPKVVETNMI